MKRILLLFTGFLLVFSISGQFPDDKAGIKFYEKVTNLKDYQGPLSKGERQDSLLSQLWDNTIPGWINSTKEISTYALGSQVDIAFMWDKTANPKKWINASKTEYGFDGSGNMTSMTYYDWDNVTIPNKWLALSRTINTYSGGNNTLSVGYTWNGVQWEESTKKESTFHPNGKIKTSVMSMLFFTQWTNLSKEEYYYDLTWKDTLEINYDWDMISSKWEVSEKTRFAYNPGGEIITETTLSWDETLPVPGWVLSEKVENTYDLNGKITSVSSFQWDKNTSGWIGLMKIETGYTGEDPTLITVYHWDKIINPATGWVYYYKTEKTGSGTIPKSVKYYEMTGYKWDVNKWINEDKDTYYYSDQSTTIFNDTYDKSLNVYPNPAGEFIIFDLTDISESATVEVYDLHGKKVAQHKLHGNNQMNINNLSKGLYIYKLYNNSITYKGKFLIE